MPWPWWVYCIVPGIATAYIITNVVLDDMKRRGKNPYAAGDRDESA